MGGFAWVTLATNDSYSLGALVLAHSLRRVGTKHDLAVLVTPSVTPAMRQELSLAFTLLQEVDVLDSKDEANLALLARPELGITFTKLHCWRLTEYEKCVFVDADTLVIRNCDELFDREELSAAPDVGWPDCFNSGVFVFKPSQQTFASLTSFAAAKGSFDGGDQGLLNQYFSDWAHKDISKHLPFIYNMCSTATYSYLPAYKQFGDDVRIIHFIGITKPWLQYFDTITSQVQPAPGSHHLLPLLQLWWNIFCDNVHPQLSPAMAGIAGALAQITLGEARSQEQVAFEEHMRKQGWEQGEIDYMGRDSFDNIWKKISETLSIQPERQPSPSETVPKHEKIEIEEETSVVAGKEEPAATKIVAAVLAEHERTDEQDDLIDEVALELKELISPLTELMGGGTSESTILTGASLSEVAAATLVPLTTASPSVVPLPEISSTSERVGSIATASCDVKIPAAIDSPADNSKIVEEIKLSQAPPGALEKPDKVDGDKEKTADIEILSESQVPIQVAESVLEADVKESVSEDLKPVTEEAFSSISQTAQESVPAVLETAMEAGHSIAPRSNASASPIGNGIDDPPPNRLASATIAVVERGSDLLEPAQSQDLRSPIVSPAEPSNVEENVPMETAQPIPVLSRSTESLEKPENDAPVELAQSTETLQNIPPAQSMETSADPLTGSQESTVTPAEPNINSQISQTVSIPIEKCQESSTESVSTTASITETATVAEKLKSVEPAQSDVSAESTKTQKSEFSVSTKVDQPKLPEPASIKTDPIVCPIKPTKKSHELSEKTEKSGTSKDLPVSSSYSTGKLSAAASATEDVPKKPVDKDGKELVKSPRKDPKEPVNKKDSKASATEETSGKSTTKKYTEETIAKVPKALVDKDALKVSITKEIPKDSAEKQVLGETIEKSDSKKSIEASSEESSPIRPARTKELQIPDTPTIIEATPPTSPPIGGAESLEEQQQTSKVTKKTVKKVVKKTTEAKPADGNEVEAEGKKVTKKIVKKVVKKKDEDGNLPAEATSTTEKPKKIVKVVKKTTAKTTSQTLDAEAAVPETPPPGSPEVPVPPKRKIKTITKTTTVKSDSEQ